MSALIVRDSLDEKLREHSVDLEVLAHTDKLTKIANRLMFDVVLERELIRARRGNDYLSLILLDVFFQKD